MLGLVGPSYSDGGGHGNLFSKDHKRKVLWGRDGGTVHILASAVVAIRPDSGFRGQGEIKGWPASTRVDFIIGRSDSLEFVTETPDEVEAMRAALVDA